MDKIHLTLPDPPAWSEEISLKINKALLKRRAFSSSTKNLNFSSCLLLAPMAAICSAPYRLLMQDLGAGGSVSELISCDGINYGNQKTLDMMYLDPREKNVGIQLFGEDPDSMVKAAVVSCTRNPDFIDINLGCPVKKVVKKGGGAALLQDINQLGKYLGLIKRELDLPLTIKIRTGWNENSLIADEVVYMAKDLGIEWVAIHGRTREQQYRGEANWDYLEELAKKHNDYTLIGNGDLHTPHIVSNRLKVTHFSALMIARGCLRNPFIFLESFLDAVDYFSARDYVEVIQRLNFYQKQVPHRHERGELVFLKKMIVWFATGFKNASHFRNILFTLDNVNEVLDFSKKYFSELDHQQKKIDPTAPFMQGGHG